MSNLLLGGKHLFGAEEDGHVRTWRLCTYWEKRQVDVLSSNIVSDTEESFRGALSSQRLGESCILFLRFLASRAKLLCTEDSPEGAADLKRRAVREDNLLQQKSR